MSGGQFAIPLVIRIATGGGRRVAAQHSHSLEGWYAHIPGLRILAPATVEDARFMLIAALKDPNPVLIFEHVMLYNLEGDLSPGVGEVDIGHAKVRRPGRDITLITYGGSLFKTLEAAALLEREGLDAEVLDLRVLRPLDTAAILESVAQDEKCVIVDEGGEAVAFRGGRHADRRGGLLRARRAYPPRLRPRGADALCAASRGRVPSAGGGHRRGGARTPPADMIDFKMPALGADMESGTLVEWLVKPGDEVGPGNIVAVVETQKGAIEVEIFSKGKVVDILAPVGEKVPVGTMLAHIDDGKGAAAAPSPAPPPAPVPVSAPAPVLRPPSSLRRRRSPPTGRVKASPVARRRAAALASTSPA